jgi:hypothetical protein
MVAAYNRLFSVLILVSCGLALAACSDDTSDPSDDAGPDGGVDGGGSGGGGRGGSGGRGGTSGRGGSGAENECEDPSDNDCDENATCNDTDDGYECECNAPAYEGDGESCECADGYSEVDGECVGEDGAECEDDAGCENGHCVEGICCASACDEPSQCQLAEGATCADGATCVYPSKADDTACDDENLCTEDDVCEDGVCAGDGSNVAATTSCGDPDMCSTTGYHCAGNARGDCISDNPTDCTSFTDECHTGICDPATGCMAMAAEVGTACDDGDACMSGETCDADGVCGGATPTACDDSNPCTDDACSSTVGCTATPNNAATCVDSDPCTINEQCNAGVCEKDDRDCSGMTNVCNLGVCDPTDGSCDAMPRPNTTPCDDTDSCTATDLCNNGTCTGTGNACGANATACTEGTPNDCTCAANYVDNNAGQCVPLVDECAPGMNPCHANATCDDPTNAVGDVDCTCNTGYLGNGITCTDIDECASNPCGAGRGNCTQGAPGTYSCACLAGFTAVDATSDGVSNPSCVCNMDGTFAVRVATNLVWMNVDGIANGSATVYSWVLRRHTYEADGSLTSETTECGATTPDLCGTTPFATEAFAQYVPNHVWGRVSMPVGMQEIQLPNAYAGQPFVTPNKAVVLGMSLTNPELTGASGWPAGDQNVGAGPNQTNGAIWVDHDGDGPLGMTSLNVTGAVSDDDAGMDDPPINYAATSPACGGDAYSAWPGIDSPFALRRVTRFYTATRLISRFDGAFDSCDRIDGAVRGPANGNTIIHSDLRFYGCVDDSPDSTCSQAMIDFYDDTPQSQQITGSTFVMLRVADNTTCDQVRVMAFPP